jgi:hypothetical protein
MVSEWLYADGQRDTSNPMENFCMFRFERSKDDPVGG